MKQIILNNGIVKYNIEVISADISIHSSVVESPIIKCAGTFDIVDKNSIVKIKQIFKNNTNDKKSNSKNLFRNKNIFIRSNISNSTVIQIDGDQAKVFVNGKEISNNDQDNLNDEKYSKYNNIPKKKEEPLETPSLEIILPLNSASSSFEITSVSGDIDIKNLFLKSLVIDSTSADIKMEQFDSLMSKINTISGDINAEIIESIANYRTKLNTISGDITKNTYERSMPKLINTKHEFEANTVSGDIMLLFKGQRRR